jgi:16S rRNA (cytosine1402-N4)-methyltransferase
MGELLHRPVLLNECIQALKIQPEGIYIDGTLGRGGHSEEIAKRLSGKGRLICIDRDSQAIAESAQRLAPWKDRITFLHGNFADLAQLLDAAEVPPADGMLFDLGVSSPQLDDGARGFSYMQDAPLDMRMNQDDPLTAWTVVNQWPRQEIRRILSEYGEERYAGPIAAAIDRRREEKPIETTLELVEVIRSAMPAAALREKQHPAKRSFQGIRIAVNDELTAVSRMLQAAIPRLAPGGRLAVISFHSLEDRIVKSELAAAAKGCDCPPSFPVCVCGKKPQVKLVSRKPILPTPEELTINPRARSAKLRVAEKQATE